MSITAIGAPHRIARPALVLIAVAIASLAGARLGRAETPVREARDLYEAGLQSYRAGNYDDAIAKLESSYQLVQAPELLYDLAQAHRLKGDCANARTLYRQFLDREPGGSVETLARSHLAGMDRCVADGAQSKAPAPIALPPPPSVRPVDLAAVPDLVSGRADRVDEAAPVPHRSRRAALAVGATALGFAAATGYFAWRADLMSDRVSSMFLPGMQWSAAGMNDQQSGRTSETLGIVTAVGALVSGGISLWLVTRD